MAKLGYVPVINQVFQALVGPVGIQRIQSGKVRILWQSYFQIYVYRRRTLCQRLLGYPASEKIRTDSKVRVLSVLSVPNRYALTPELLTLVDDGRISLTPAVEISYLSQDEQYALLEAIQSEDRTPSLSQAQQLRKLSQSGELDADRALQIMCQPKANQMEKISLDYGELRRFFPRRYTPREIQAAILKLVEADYKRRQRAIER